MLFPWPVNEKVAIINFCLDISRVQLQTKWFHFRTSLILIFPVLIINKVKLKFVKCLQNPCKSKYCGFALSVVC